MHSLIYGSLEAYYIDSSSNIKHKTFINVRITELNKKRQLTDWLETDYQPSQNLQRLYIHITAKNQHIKRRRERDFVQPLQYPLLIANCDTTDYFPIFYIDVDIHKSPYVPWVPPHSTKQRLIFDRMFRIKLLQKPHNVLKSMVDDVVTHYTKEFHVDSCLNDLIFKYYDDPLEMDSLQCLYDLFSKREDPMQCSISNQWMVPSEALDAVRNWLEELNIVRYYDDTSSDISDVEQMNVSDCTEIKTCYMYDEESAKSNEWQKMFGGYSWYYSTCDELLVNEADYDLKYKLSHKKLTSRCIRKEAKLQHDRYAKPKKRRHSKYVCMDVDGIRLKIKSKERDAKYAKKSNAVKQSRRIARAEKHRKKSQRHTNRLLKLRLIDREVDATYWTVPPYDFV